MDKDEMPTIIPPSPAQKLITKVDRRDKLVRALEIALLLVFVLINIFTLYRIQAAIKRNEQDAVRARAIITGRQNETKEYIKCVLLIRYDVPPEKLTNRADTEKALDDCALKSSDKK